MRHARLVALATLALGLALASSAVAAPGWTPRVDLSQAGENAFGQQVALDAQGNAVAVWQRYDGATFVVQATSRTVGGSWQPPVTLSAPGEIAQEPQVAVDAAGDAVAVWQRNDGTNYVIQASVRPSGGAWGAPVDLSAAGQTANEPRVAVDPQGEALAVWRRFDGVDYVVQAAARPAGGDWQAPVTLSVSLSGRAADEPAVALDPHGDAVATWNRFNGANEVVQAAERPAGGSWTEPTRLSELGQNAGASQVALDSAGNAVAVWQRNDGANYIVQASERPVGGLWQAAADLSAPGENATGQRVAIDANGDAIAIWERFNGSNEVIQAAARPGGASWQAPVDLSPGGEPAGNPALAIDPAGDALGLWYRFDGAHEIIQAAARPRGGGWQAPVDLTGTGEQAGEPHVAFDPQGNANAAWDRLDATTHTIVQTATYDVLGPTLNSLQIPASGVAGRPLAFSVSPLDAWSALGATTWSFGDGSSASGTSVTHAYAAAGSYGVTLSSADALGNASAAGAVVAVTPAPPGGQSVAPVIGSLRQSHSTWREGNKLAGIAKRPKIPIGTTFSFSINEPAHVSLSFTQRLSGRTVKRRCVVPTRKSRHRRACKRTVVRGTLAFTGRAGAHRVSFQGRISRAKRLAPGRYTLVVTAANTAGQRARSVSVGFKIVR